MIRNGSKDKQCEETLYGYLCKHAGKRPGAPFLLTRQETITYGKALRIVQSTSAFLSECGVGKGEIVALRATRNKDVALLSLSLCAIGAVVALTDAHFNVKEYIEDIGIALQPDWIISNERAGGGLAAGGDWCLEDRSGRLFPLNLQERNRRAEAVLNADDPFLIIFTSGSTGKSKAVVLSHKNCVANPVDAMPLFQENARDRAVALLPLNHIFGYSVISCATFCGHGVVFPETTETEPVLQCIEKFRITCIYSVPTFFLDLLSRGRHKNYDISSLRLGLMAGGPFTAEQMRYIERELGLRLMPGYGMSECVGISTMAYRDDVEERAAGVGRPYPMTEVIILDENGKEKAVGEIGEICVKGKTLMLGYYGADGKIYHELDENGRLHTGDLGFFDEKGLLHIDGRIKDLIIRGGENISAGKIEKAILSLEGVYQAAAFGVKDARFGEIPCAAVIPADGVDLSEDAIRSALSNILCNHEIPSRVLILASLPLTSSGKIDKQKLKEMM